MKLKSLLNVMGAGEFVRIGTENGRGWIIYGEVRNMITSGDKDFLDRKVENVHSVPKREKEYSCCELEKGIAITVAGDESGSY